MREVVRTMGPLRVKPTRTDVTIARGIARHTRPVPEKVADALTYGADERVLLVLAGICWLLTRDKPPPLKRAGNHALLVTATVSFLPHLFKRCFNQVRPDRLTVKGHLRGIPLSGHADDAFPSGHALHMGALAAAAQSWPRGWRGLGIALATFLSLTRIAVLAHWASDVAAGFALGAAVERAMRRLTRYPEGLNEPAAGSKSSLFTNGEAFKG
ncbi:phosphatase PAP2 family protein [Bradyrhizobium sp.]|uniref:phosphatase PAP2 family protein n=1 Tax=Bradyrhizobium sp. TaxID=376 RepID=UPI002D7381C2|nr:phosphatase PAP2 family protein [Bradyrhizobium sp.]HZR76113.1 phosphatase PAP2 family protein [Bradyrhizobium sp.]